VWGFVLRSEALSKKFQLFFHTPSDDTSLIYKSTTQFAHTLNVKLHTHAHALFRRLTDLLPACDVVVVLICGPPNLSAWGHHINKKNTKKKITRSSHIHEQL
jgi:hypothetical protein